MLPFPAFRTRANMPTLRRVLSVVAPLSSILLLATCDLDKLTAPKSETPGNSTVEFTISGADQVILAGSTTLSATSHNNTSVRWSSTAPTIAAVDSVTGVVTGLTIGAATIRARLLAMHLDTGVVATKAVTVRYKGIRIAAIDSITGLGLTRTAVVNGLNASDAVQPGALTGAALTLSIRDSGSANATVASLTSGVVKGLKAGVAYLKAIYETSLIDSVKVRVRPVAKAIAFTDTVFTSNALLFNRTIPVTVRDVADSIILAPTLRWRSSDTNKVAIDSMTGVLRVKVRDTARVFVRMDTVNRSIKVRLIQQVGSLTRSQGDAQSDTIGRILPTALRVTALDSGGVAVPNATVTFRVGTGGGTITDSVKTTDASGQATLGSWRLGTAAGAQTVIASVGTISTTFTATAAAAAAQKLAFTVQPTAAAVGAAIAPAIRVTVQDSAGNVVTSATNPITLSFSTNPNTAATLGGTLTVNAANGVATFSNISVSGGGSGFVLLASATGLSSAVSNSFDVFGAPTKLGFVTQPTGASAGGVMQPVRVAVQDANGATVVTATDSVTLTLGNPGTASLSGTRKVAAVNGVATFSDLSVNTAGSGYTLIASAPSRTSATSSAFTVAPVGTPARFSFSVQPSNSVSGQPIAPAVKVQVLDENGALVTSSTQQITLSVQDGTPLSGTFVVSASAGEATFSNVVVNKAGTGYRLVASATGTSITSATSNTFNVTAAGATKLGFSQNPTHTVTGQTITPAVRVAVQDAQGNTVTSHPATSVTVALSGAGCTPSALSGNAPVSTSGGEATFNVLAVSQQLSNCTLTATATGLQSATSTAFNIVASNGAVRLRFTTQPASSTTAGSTMNAGTVNFQDAAGTNVTAPAATNVSISVLSGPGTIACCGTTSYNTSTAQAFPGISFQTAGRYRLLVSATGYRPDTSAEFTITPATANRLGFITQPSNIVAGVPFSTTIQVAVQDQYGNTVTGATDAISISSSLSVSPFTGLRLNNGLFTITANAVNGIASFPGLSVRGAGTPARLHANTPSFGTSSNQFSVFAGPLVKLGFKDNVSQNITAGATFAAVEVQGQDSVGNVIPTFDSPVTLTLTGGNPAAVLNGTKTKAAASGIATFTDLSVNEAASGYRLSASASGVATAVTNTFTIQPGPTTKIGWIRQPANTFANAPLGASGALPRVANMDQFGNTTGDCSGVKVTLVSPPAGMTLRYNGFDQTQVDFGQNPCSGFTDIPALLTISRHGTGIQLLAASHNTNFGTATSAAFNIGAFDTPTKVGFVKQPSNTSYGVTFSDTVTVAIQDQYGNTDTTATGTVTLALSTNPGGATLSTTSLAAVKGVAKFHPLTLNKAGTGYVITASSGTLTTATSSAFNVTSPGILANTNYICDMTRQGDVIWFVDCNSSGSLWSVPVTGGTPVQRVIGIPQPQRMASDANNVYWIEAGASNGTGAVRKYNIATGAVTTMANGLFDIHWEKNTFAVDGTNVYFMARNAAGTTRAIRSVAISVGGPTTPTDIVAPGSCTGCVPYFTIGSGQIFYYDFNADAIRRVATTGGTPVSLTNSGVGNTQMLELNGTTLLLSQRVNLKTIANANTITGPVAPATQIESGINFNTWLADGSFLYVNNNGALVRYSLADFGASTSLGVTLHNHGQHGFVTNAVDVFAFNSNFQLTKVPK